MSSELSNPIEDPSATQSEHESSAHDAAELRLASAHRMVVTEDWAAVHFSRRHARHMRYDTGQGWFVWDKTHWKPDEAAVVERIRGMCRNLAELFPEKIRQRMGRASFIRNVADLAQTDPRACPQLGLPGRGHFWLRGGQR